MRRNGCERSVFFIVRVCDFMNGIINRHNLLSVSDNKSSQSARRVFTRVFLVCEGKNTLE